MVGARCLVVKLVIQHCGVLQDFLFHTEELELDPRGTLDPRSIFTLALG